MLNEELNTNEELKLLSITNYNLIAGGLLLFALILHFFLVSNVGDFLKNFDPLIFVAECIVSFLLGTILPSKTQNTYIHILSYYLIIIPFGLLIARFIPENLYETYLLSLVMVGIVVIIMLLAIALLKQLFANKVVVLISAFVSLVLTQIIFSCFNLLIPSYAFIIILVFILLIAYIWSEAQDYPPTINNAIGIVTNIYKYSIVAVFAIIFGGLASPSDSRKRYY